MSRSDLHTPDVKKCLMLCCYYSCIMVLLPVFQIGRIDQDMLWLGPPLDMVPDETLPSEKTVLRASHGLFDNSMKK